VEVGIEHEYEIEVTGLATDQMIDFYKITAYEIGSNGSLNGEPGSSGTTVKYIYTSNSSITVPIVWDGTTVLENDFIEVIAHGKNVLYDLWDDEETKEVFINGINPGLYVQGSTPDKCCTESIVYQVKNYGMGNEFSWSYPSGWSTSGQTDGSSITLIPNALSGGQVSCTVKREEAVDSYSESASYTINRPEPSFGSNAILYPSKICSGQTVSLSVNELCGAYNYQWQLPPGWTLNSGQGSSQITAYTANPQSSGFVSVAASFNGGCTAQTTRRVDVITTVPDAPTFDLKEDEHDLGYHCDKFNVCPSGTRVYIEHMGNNIDNYYWQTSSGWYPNGASTTNPYIDVWGVNPPSSGVLTVSAKNCIGTGPSTSLVFYKEDPYWCENPYPIYCDCCEPPEPGDPIRPLSIGGSTSKSSKANSDKKTKTDSPDDKSLLSEQALQISPNPGNGKFDLSVKNKGNATIQVKSITGKTLHTLKTADTKLSFDLSNYPNGFYLINISQNGQTKTLKYLKQ